MTNQIASKAYLEACRGPEVIRSTAAVAVLATLAVIGRLISRKLQKRKYDASDYTICVGLIGCWGMAAVLIASVSYGMGKHVQVVPLKDITKILQMTFATEILYSITLPTIKISILLLYRSIFPGREFAMLTNVVGLTVIAWGLAILLVSIFSCLPIDGFWDITIRSACINTRNFFIGNAVPNICADVFILALPLKKVWHLKIPSKSKIAVSALFLLGGFVCVVSGIRLYFLLSIDQMDISWSYSEAAIWSSVEVNVAVISACLPTIRPVLQNIGQKFTCIGSITSGSGKWSRGFAFFGSSNSSENSKTTQSGKRTFQCLPEYPLDHMSVPQPTGPEIL